MRTIEGHDVKIFTDNIEQSALEQIEALLSIDVNTDYARYVYRGWMCYRLYGKSRRQGNLDWNCPAPHGAGRVMSRHRK